MTCSDLLVLVAFTYKAILFNFAPLGESHVDFCTQGVIMTLAGCWEHWFINNDVLKFRKILKFQSSCIVMNCQ